MLNRICLIFILAFTAACGGSSTAPVADVTYLQDPLDILETVRDLAPRNPQFLQSSGTAVYTGGLTIEHTPDDALFGTMRLNVDFGSDSFDGTADRFVDGSRIPFDGVLDITEGVIDREGDFAADYSATALIEGTLTSADDDVTVNGFVVGDFAGGSGQFYRGFLRIGLNGLPYQDGAPFGGIVGAERQ